MIKARVEAGSVYIDGKPATAVQLRADHEARYGENLKDFDKLLYATDTRKKDQTPYLTKLVQVFVGRKDITVRGANQFSFNKYSAISK